LFSCKLTRDDIKNYIKKLEKNDLQRRQKAKDALKNKDKDKAKIFLSQSKLYREQIKTANGQLNMIEDQILQIDSAKHQKEAIKVLQNGNKILKELYEEVNVEKWEKIADDMNEIKQQQDEIGNFLKNHGMSQKEYDEDVDKELDNLMKQDNYELNEILSDDNLKSNSQLKHNEKETSDRILVAN
jgi:hypothetical protein